MNEDEEIDLIVTQCAECGTGIDVTENQLLSGLTLLCMCCAWGINDDDQIDC